MTSPRDMSALSALSLPSLDNDSRFLTTRLLEQVYYYRLNIESITQIDPTYVAKPMDVEFGISI